MKEFSKLVSVQQRFPDRGLTDIRSEVTRQLASSGLDRGLMPGGRIAIGVGSRGIMNLATIVRTVVQFWQSRGFRPFLFPAMGSHGAATAEGQANVLAGYGIAEAEMGCPVVSSFDVVSLGRSELGVEAFADRAAWESDGVMLINRVKWHTGFAGKIESGVCKMMAIGLGKIEGAKSCHAHGRRHGMEAVIRSVGERALASGKVLGGLAILEDAHHNTAEVAALPAATLIEREEELLQRVKSWMPRVPVDELDVLIIDEVGKNISGTGMDTKVVNRGVLGQYNPWPDTPRIQRIFIRDLSRHSYGNGLGIGLADVIHDRVLEKIDLEAGWVNAITSGSLPTVRTPIHFPSDRKCLETLAVTVGKFDPREVTIGRIRNTLELGSLWMTENTVDRLKSNVELALGDARPMEFDSAGNLI